MERGDDEQDMKNGNKKKMHVVPDDSVLYEYKEE